MSYEASKALPPAEAGVTCDTTLASVVEQVRLNGRARGLRAKGGGLIPQIHQKIGGWDVIHEVVLPCTLRRSAGGVNDVLKLEVVSVVSFLSYRVSPLRMADKQLPHSCGLEKAIL